jgi:hypothetical protein
VIAVQNVLLETFGRTSGMLGKIGGLIMARAICLAINLTGAAASEVSRSVDLRRLPCRLESLKLQLGRRQLAFL